MVDVNSLDVNAIVDASQYVPQVDSGVLSFLRDVPVVGQFLAGLSVNEVGILIFLVLLFLWSLKGKAVIQIMQILIIVSGVLIVLGVLNF